MSYLQWTFHMSTFTSLLLHCFNWKYSLWKHAYSNILKHLPAKKKNENFQIKNSDIYLISAQNIDCGYSLEPPRRGGSNEYSQSMFLSRNKKNNVYPWKPVLLYKSGVQEGQNNIGMFSWCGYKSYFSTQSCWYSLKASRRGAPNVYHYIFLMEIPPLI